MLSTGIPILLAVALRLWGLTWSLPNGNHYFSYHPDEILIIRASHAADIWSGQFNPHFYNYGSLVVYLNSLFRPLAYALLAPSVYTDYLLGRFLTVLFGVGTILLCFGMGKSPYHRFGVAVAFLLALTPAHALHSHYLTVDVPATFWVTLCLFCCFRALPEGNERWWIFAGLAAGLAAGTKYNAGLVILSVMVGCWRHPRILLTSLGVFLLAFLMSTPGILLWPGEFWRDFSYELGHTRTGHGLVFVGTAPGWLFHWWINLRWGLGLPLLLLTTATFFSALYHLWRRRSPDHQALIREQAYSFIQSFPQIGEEQRWLHVEQYLSLYNQIPRIYPLLFAFIVPYYLLISGAEVKFLRYTLPLLPPLLILSAIEGSRANIEGFFRFSQSITSRFRAQPPTSSPEVQENGGFVLIGCLKSLVYYAVFIYTLLYTIGYVGWLSQVPPQDQAVDWLHDHAQARSVGLTTVPWFYSPPISRYNGGPQSARAFEEHLSESPYLLKITGTDAAQLTAASPEFFVLSDYETDAARLIQNPKTAQLPEVRQFARFMDALRQNYDEKAVFNNRPLPLPLWLTPGDPPPHDWRYPNPTLTLWQRKPH